MISPSDRWSAHLSLLYQEHPEPLRPQAASADGFRWVESWWIDDEHVRGCFMHAVANAAVDLACLNAAAGDLAAGQRGMLNVPESREAAMAAIVEAIDLTASVSGRTVNVLVGREIPGMSHEKQLRAVRDALREVASEASGAGVVLVVEHLNELDIPGYLLPTPLEAARLIESVGSDQVRLLYDGYHAARIGIDPVEDVGAYVSLIGHAQYAEAPLRTAPGTGSGSVWKFAAALAEGGYEGPIGLEYQPAASTTDSLSGLAASRSST